MIPMTDTMTRRIALLGKTGSGKSSLANTIISENVFKVNHSPNSGTEKCDSETRNVNGHDIHVVDTPGLFDTDPSNTAVSRELLKCITECAPGPHAFLLVLKIEKYTVLEMAVVNLIRQYFTEEALKYTTVVFTRGDDLPEGMRIEEWVEQNKSLNDLVQKCGGRCHVFDNKYWKNSEDEYRNNQYQITELLKTIDEIVADNGGKYYTNTALEKTGEQIQKEIARVTATLSADKPFKEVRKMAKENVLEILWSRVKGNKAGIILGALLGVGVMVPLVVFALPCAISAAVIGLTSVAAGAAAGGEIQHAVKKSKRRRQENVKLDVAEKPLLEQDNEEETEEEEETEKQEEEETEEQEEILPLEQAEEKVKEWQYTYQEYKKLQ